MSRHADLLALPAVTVHRQLCNATFRSASLVVQGWSLVCSPFQLPLLFAPPSLSVLAGSSFKRPAAQVRQRHSNLTVIQLLCAVDEPFTAALQCRWDAECHEPLVTWLFLHGLILSLVPGKCELLPAWYRCVQSQSNGPLESYHESQRKLGWSLALPAAGARVTDSQDSDVSWRKRGIKIEYFSGISAWWRVLLRSISTMGHLPFSPTTFNSYSPLITRGGLILADVLCEEDHFPSQ